MSDKKYLDDHARVRDTRGSARDQICIGCQFDAQGWAHIHGTDETDPYNYVPLCSADHSIYDRFKLSSKEIREVEHLLNTTTMSQNEIAYKFGVTKTTVQKIRRGRVDIIKIMESYHDSRA